MSERTSKKRGTEKGEKAENPKKEKKGRNPKKEKVFVWFQGRGRDVRAVLAQSPLCVETPVATVEFADESKLRVRLATSTGTEFSRTVARMDDELEAYVATLVEGSVARCGSGVVTFKARCGSTVGCAVEVGARVRVTVRYAGVSACRRGIYRNEWSVVSVTDA